MKYQKNKIYKTYVTNRKFGKYFLPARFQNKIISQYCNENNLNFSLPAGEIVFGETYIQMRSLIDELKKNNGVIFISIEVLPLKFDLKEKVLREMSKKNLEVHFIFENKKLKSKKDFEDFIRIFKIANFTES